MVYQEKEMKIGEVVAVVKAVDTMAVCQVCDPYTSFFPEIATIMCVQDCC